ncbi:MAG: hypothetical protein ACRBN8_44670 [Nannocystales bacterium]
MKEEDPHLSPHVYLEFLRHTIGLKVQSHCPSTSEDCIMDVTTLLFVYEMKRLAYEDLSEAFLAEAAALAADDTAAAGDTRRAQRRAQAAAESAAKAQQDAVKVFEAVWALSNNLPPPDGSFLETYDCSGIQPNDRLSAKDAEYLRGLCIELNEVALQRLAESETPPECARVSGSAGGSRTVARFCVDLLSGSMSAPGTTPSATCCKVCGPTSQACGDTCISFGKTCHTAPGCACQ